jgi:hypothetical protein
VKAYEKVAWLVYSWGEDWASGSLEKSSCRSASVTVVEMVWARVVEMVVEMVAEMVVEMVWVRVVERVWVRAVERAGERF